MTENRESIWSANFLRIFVVNILVNASLYMVNTLVPKASADLNAPVTVVALVVSTFAVTSLVSRPFVGISGSIMRSRTILCISAGILAGTYGVFSLADNVPMMILGRLMQGIGMAFVGPICLTVASNSLPQHRLASGIAIFSIGQASANAFGPSIGLWLAEKAGYSLAFFTAASLMLLALFISLSLTRDEFTPSGTVKLSLNTFFAREALVPGIIFFFLGGAYSCVVSYVVLYGESCGIGNCGVFFTSYAIFVMLSRLISGRLGEKYGMSAVIISAMVFYAVSFYIISISRTTVMFIFAGAFSALGYGICQPSIQALCMMKVPGERRSVAGNTCYLGVDMGYLVMPSVAGAIVAGVQSRGGSITQGYVTMYRVMPVAIICALLIYLIYRSTGPKTKESP